MKEISTSRKLKLKKKSQEEPSQKTLDYLMLLARSFDIKKKDVTPLDFKTCLN